MNKTALKSFATNARKELIEKVKAKAFKIGITEENIKKAQFESSDAIYIDGKQLTATEKKQREKLISRINEIGYQQVIEEVAYTWFNRFTALRFMEVNNYLPTKVRVLSSNNADSSEPDIIKEALTVDLDIDKEMVYELKLNNKTEELYKYLVIKQCNSLNKVLPFMFETIDDYKEILFPEGLLSKDSFVREMINVTAIPESDWEQVEIIGWLYQFYISEKKDQVFADLKKNIKITKETIPAATQIFTPNWIVQYMVQNSLGRMWLESYPESSLKSDCKYYLDEVEQHNEVKAKLKNIQYKDINPEEISFLDPSCGSGHILVYAFDILFEMYLEKGYIQSEIPKLIIEKNLYGLDIDNRAIQLASFAVMMKARGKYRRAFDQDIKLNLCALQESNWITDEIIEMLTDKQVNSEQEFQRKLLNVFRDTFSDAKDYGSIISIDKIELDSIEKLTDKLLMEKDEQVDILEWITKVEVHEKMPGLVLQAKILSRRYDVVCTNPPYMGSSGMGEKLSDYLKTNYPDTKSDLFATFIEKGFELTKVNGYNAMVTMQSWMFLPSFEKLREKIIQNKTISNLLHMDNMVMGIAFGTSATVFRNAHIPKYRGNYNEVKYGNINGNVPLTFPIPENRNAQVSSENFTKITGMPIAYWVSEKLIAIFDGYQPISYYGKPCKGIDTGDNNRFLKMWFEIELSKLGRGFQSYSEAMNSDYSYYPYNKGGAYRKWYGNNEYVIWWNENGKDVKEFRGSNLRNKDCYRKDGLTWSTVTSGNFSIREFGYGYYFDNGGSCLFIENKKYYMALLNSKIYSEIQKLSPTVNFQPGEIGRVPVVKNEKYIDTIIKLAETCVKISKLDWDNYETSWEFKTHPLIVHQNNTGSMEKAFSNWEVYSLSQFNELKATEESINGIFINLYGLNEEISSEVEEKDISLGRADRINDVKSFISYAVGCMLGRYSLDEEAIIYAGGKFEAERFKKFSVDKDNILPILPGSYFEDDIIDNFIEFVKVSFGENELESNLEFIADSLGNRNGESSKEVIRDYFINQFFKDHVQIYKKRPIYWLYTSGKQKAFNCLIYMHRYDKSTLSRIRTDYLHELQIRMDAEKKALLDVINGDGTTKEIANAKKELKSLDLKIEELRAYDEKLHHMADMQIEIDLDDGVAVNYAKFEGLLAPIR